MSLRTRIAAAAGLAVAVAVICAAAVVYLGVRSELRGEVERSLSARADAISRFGPGGPEGGPPGGPGQGPLSGGRPGPDFERRLQSRSPFGGAQGYAQVVRPDGSVLRPPGDPARLPVEERAREIAREGSGRYWSDMQVDGTNLRVLTQGVAPGGAVQVARPLEEVDRQLDRILLILVLVAVGGVALAAALGAVVARTALAPITRFTRRTETLTADADLTQRMEVEGDDELARLAHSFNTTLDALERSVEAQRHLVADASHELRTPIASLRANIQTLEDADRLPAEERALLRADIVEELDELTDLVSDVVELARGTRPPTALDDVRLDHVAESLAERARRRTVGRLTLATDLEATVVRGEPERIGRAVSNLIENAVEWSPTGASIEISLHDGTLIVRDHGPGFAAEDLPHVFERFYRADAARGMPGSGLGLAIVRQAAEAHGGRAEAANAPGGGALMRVSFGSTSAPSDEAVGAEPTNVV